MFCPNCGNEVQDGSNFCPNCGKNLKNVKITITERKPNKKSKKNVSKDNSSTETKKSANQETQIFKPLKNLDGIDSTNEISDIIKAVDEKISENIHKYETNSFAKEDLKITEDKKVKDNSKNISESSDNKVNNNEHKKTKNKASEKVAKASGESDLNKVNHKPEKFSLKRMWKNFINEDDNEFSIFSSMENKKETNDDKIELVNGATSTANQTMIATDTTSIPKSTIEEKLQELENEEIVAKIEDKKHEIKNSISHTVESKAPEKETSKTNKKEKKSSEEINNNNVNISEKTSKTKKSSATNNNTKLKDPKEKLSHKSFTDKVNEELRKMEEQKKSDTSTKGSEEIKTENKDNNPKKDKKSLFTKNNESKKSLKTEKVELKKEADNKFIKLMNFIIEKINVVNSFAYEKGKNGVILLAVVGVILSLIPIVIGSRKITFFIVVLLALKLLFSALEFYIPLNIATDKVWVETSEDEVKYFAFINWFICNLFLFLAFILSPWNGFFTFKLLPALTPLPIATIILFLMAILISLAQYWPQLKNENKTNFVAWYLIPFMLIHFASKLIFVLINFVA